jgi:hypothetical protein
MDVHKKKTKKKSASVPAKEKRGRGRPATGRVRPDKITVRLNEDERIAIETAAEAAEETPGNWLREQGLNAAGFKPTPPERHGT